LGPTSLSFVAVCRGALARSIAFYERLGFAEVARFRSEHDDAAHLRIDGPLAMQEVVLAPPGGGEGVYIVVGFERPGAEAGAARPANTLGIWRVAFSVADIDAAAAALQAAGAALLSPPVEMAMGPGLPLLRFVCATGPDGEIVECIENLA
jgi:catechol 2,3-dioxygenase-like lactoylglutathione lyase family enzyme